MNDFYKEIFSIIDGVTVFSEPLEDYFSNHWLSAILIEPVSSQRNREELRLFLEKNNIESRPLWKPMHLQPVFKEAPYYGDSVSEKLFENGLCLPSGSNLSDEDKQRIKDCIIEFFGG